MSSQSSIFVPIHRSVAITKLAPFGVDAVVHDSVLHFYPELNSNSKGTVTVDTGEVMSTDTRIEFELGIWQDHPPYTEATSLATLSVPGGLQFTIRSDALVSYTHASAPRVYNVRKSMHSEFGLGSRVPQAEALSGRLEWVRVGIVLRSSGVWVAEGDGAPHELQDTRRRPVEHLSFTWAATTATMGAAVRNFRIARL